jgi:transcriptional regulator with XRE-family HTH domain
MARKTLGEVLKGARMEKEMTLREVERETEISNAHLSQVENGTIAQPEMSLLYVLATLYELDYRQLLQLAGHASADQEGSGRERQRMSVAMRAMGELSAKEQNDVLAFMSELRKSKGDG